MDMNDKKYTLSDEDTLIIEDGDREVILHRIIATIDIYSADGELIVKMGEKGGYIESRANLSENGSCWVHDRAQVYGKAKITMYAQVKDFAKVYGNAYVRDNATISEDAQVYDSASVCNNACIFGNAEVFHSAKIHGIDNMIFGNAKVYNYAVLNGHGIRIYDNAWVCDYTIIGNDSQICGNAKVCGDSRINYAIIHDNAWVGGCAQIEGNKYCYAHVYGNATVRQRAVVSANASVHGDVDICGFQLIPFGAEVGRAKDDILS